jgi:rhamnose utilization protein RhaD (predicted bifunctional aldolase and dehydrogenase)/NAD(P)-dependent dehydrogenase (short-subunit alcohol dehydrogenase family)
MTATQTWSTERFASRWDPAAAPADDDLVGGCVHASRLLGSDPALVLAGGGNSSVKTVERDVHGEPVDVLWVKGSGWDMGTIEPAGFAPLRLAPVARLAELATLSDSVMANELKAASLDIAAPAPSVESILHATLPHRFVMHTHADAVVALTNTPDGRDIVRDVYGDSLVVVPYVMPGFDLARRCAEIFPAEVHDGTVGMVLLNHGLFTFADDARTAYERHVELVGRAAAHLADALGASPPPALEPLPLPNRPDLLTAIAELRRDLSRVAGHPMVACTCTDHASRRFAARADLAQVSQQGTATPDHVLRTKRLPMLGRDVDAYAAAYGAYVERNRARLGDRPLIPVDPAPRIVIDPELGVLAAGRRVGDARAAAEIWAHTVEIIEASEALGGYRSISEADLFDVEYWELEQAKLTRQPAPAPLTGRVALVTGAASGIGRACALELLARGAAVVGLDLAEAVADVSPKAEFLGIVGDVTAPDILTSAIAETVRTYGGLDLVVVNAGVFPDPVPVAGLHPAVWDHTMRVNATSASLLLGLAHPYLARAPGGGAVVVVGSKNVPAPGKGAAAYSASKAALTQLARVAALEWGDDGIRVNVVHPDAVFDTALWDDDLIATRAAAYGLTPDEYRSRNVLGAEVSSTVVATLVADLFGPGFARTTGAQIPVDGGNERVI